MDIQKRLALLKEVGEEIVKEEEVVALLEKHDGIKSRFIAYDGFEPSGRIHIAQGLLRAVNVNKVIAAGGHFKMWVADWHAWANGKLGGDLEKIQITGKYFIEVWKACGMNLDHVEFVWANEAMKDPAYWKTVMEVATKNTLKRVMRCVEIMGRSEDAKLHASQIFYPCMQAADIFYLKADIAQLGLDQRKVNMMAREVGPSLGKWKPISLSHHMLMGLQQPSVEGLSGAEREIKLKMSKSLPDTAIFMTDSSADVKRKMKNAWCPAKEVKENPVLEYCKYIVFEILDKEEYVIERPEKFGGNISFTNYSDLEKAYVAGDLHPLDLKQTTAKYIDRFLEPVREHFAKDKTAAALKEQVEGFIVTR